MRQAVCVIVFALAPFASTAQTASEPSLSEDRFQIERRGDTIVRLDRRSGEMSTCVMQGGALDCRASEDERAALQEEIDRLAAEVDRLQAELKGGTPGTGLSKGGRELTLKLPTEEELRGAMTAIEDLFRRFVESIRSLGKDGA